MNEVGMTPIIHILAIPSLRTHPTIIPHQLAAVCCVVCWLFHEIYPIHAYPLIIAHKLGPISLFDHFSASPLGGDGSQLYSMHMKHNGATRTLLLLIDGVFPIFDLYTVYIDAAATTKRPLLSPGTVHNHCAATERSPESAHEIGCAARCGGRSGWRPSMMTPSQRHQSFP
jgi:hypothetical protein